MGCYFLMEDANKKLSSIQQQLNYTNLDYLYHILKFFFKVLIIMNLIHFFHLYFKQIIFLHNAKKCDQYIFLNLKNQCN